MAIAYVVLQGLHLFAAALLIGFMAIVQWSVVPSQNHLDGRAYATFEKHMNIPLQRLTPALLVLAILTGLGTAAVAFLLGEPLAWLHLAVTAGLIAMTNSTLLINAPINDAINTWDPASPPSDWMAQRDRWEYGHAIRVAVGIPTLVLAVAAAVIG